MSVLNAFLHTGADQFLRYTDSTDDAAFASLMHGTLSRGSAVVVWSVLNAVWRRKNREASPWRDRPVGESLALFEDMRRGLVDEGKATLR